MSVGPVPRALRLAVLVVAGGLVAAALAGLWAWRTESGLAWLLGRVPGLQVQGLAGCLSGGPLTAHRLTYQASVPGPSLALDALRLEGLTLRWRPHPGAWIGIDLASARAERVVIDSGPSSAGSTPPTSLRGPVALNLASLSIGELRLDALPPARSIEGTLALGDEHGLAHRLSLHQARVENLALKGRLHVGTDGALPVDAEFAAEYEPAPALQPAPGLQEEALLRLAAALQQNSAHPLAQAVLDVKLACLKKVAA